MKSHLALLEQLEARIAPAVLVHGANLLGGADNPSTGETSLDENAFSVVKVSGGMALVWYDAATESITGISASNGAVIEVWGDILGSVVGNLTSSGLLSDSDGDPTNGQNGDVLLPNDISLTTHAFSIENGNVAAIVTGGSITNVHIDGKTSFLYAGNGSFNSLSVGGGGAFFVNTGFDINPLDGVANTTYDFVAGNYGTAFKSGASISNVSIKSGINLQIIAGDGLNPGSAGGGITNITLDSAAIEGAGTTSYMLVAGKGADSTTSAAGGLGGSITSVVEKSSSGVVEYHAGDGGNSTFGSGGHGGSISKVNAQSDQTNYVVAAGQGGNGLVNGGNGGSLTQNNFTSRDPKTGVLVSGDFTGDSVDDILVVDTGSGLMALMENTGGTTFAAVNQSGPNTPFIGSVGVTPKAALAGDLDNDGDLDFVVAYANSSNIGVYLNDGTGIFTSSVVAFGLQPADIELGHFLDPARLDIAIMTNSDTGASIFYAKNDGAGAFAFLPDAVSLDKTKDALELKSARIDANNLDDLFVGYESGTIKTLLATGSETSLFSVSSNVVSSVGNLSNLDVSADTGQLLAFSAKGKAIALFSYSSGALVAQTSVPDLTTLNGQVSVARFGGALAGNILVLSSQTGLSKITEFAPNNGVFASNKVITTESSLKTFITTNDGAGVAALTGSLSRMEYNIGGTTFTDVDLPFTGKQVGIAAGDGGNSTGAGKGGNGGLISGLNIEANQIAVTTGMGGDSISGTGGAGGNLVNSGSVTLTGGGTVAAALVADTTLTVTLGNGGNVTDAAGKGAGGIGGAINGLTASVKFGNMTLGTGAGGSAALGNGGHGGSASNLTISTKGGDFSLTLGNGGDTDGKTAGNGGGISNLTYTQELDKEVEELGFGYTATLITGNGGTASAGKGGNGGSYSSVVITLDPTNVEYANSYTDMVDSTALAVVTAGNGGSGTLGGGIGGSLTNVTVKVTQDQKKVDPADPTKGVLTLNFAALQAQAGNGGSSNGGNGGAGGTITNLKAQGLSLYDPIVGGLTPLQVIAGDGGAGTIAGGKGGSIVNASSTNVAVGTNGVLKSNMLAQAEYVAGIGGAGGSKDGGAGGSVTNLRVAVQSHFADLPVNPNYQFGGTLTVTAGNGGNSSSGKGGAGGSITSGNMVSVYATPVSGDVADSIELTAGNGGSGLLQGGAGGSLSSFTLNTPQQSAIYGSVLVAGNGGDATSLDVKAKGGVGGSIFSLKQQKDLNSFISQLKAGNGGDGGGGTGGNGGSVTSINTAGFIGLPIDEALNLGVFDSSANRPNFPQGIFAGLGGDGTFANGSAGTIANIVARQIAALSGNMLDDGSFTFAPAKSITNIKADLIGYSTTGSNTYAGVSPTVAQPADGFLLADLLSGIQTFSPARTESFTNPV